MSDQQLQDPVAAPESRRRLSKRSIVLIAAGSALVLVAAGTAAAFALAPRDSPEAEVVETTAPIETPAWVVTEKPVDRPTARFDVDCDALLPSEIVAATLGAGATQAATDDAISNLHDAYRVQTGVVGCSWSSGDAGATSSMSVTLIPDAHSDFARVAGGEFMEQMDPDAFGDSSFHGCESYLYQGVTSSRCVAHILVGDIWAAFAITAPGSEDELVGRLEGAAPHVAAAVRALTVPGPAWAPPVSPLTAEVMLNLDPATVAASFGMTDAYPTGTDVGTVTGEMMQRTGFSMVDWASPSDSRWVTVEALPGGAWAAVELASASDAVDVAGADDASILTLEDGRPKVCLAARNAALCFVPSAPTDRQAFVAQVAAFVASLPGA